MRKFLYALGLLALLYIALPWGSWLDDLILSGYSSPLTADSDHFRACEAFARRSPAIAADVGAVSRVGLRASGDKLGNRLVASPGEVMVYCHAEVDGERGKGLLQLTTMVTRRETRFEGATWQVASTSRPLTASGEIDREAEALARRIQDADAYRNRLLELRGARKHRELVAAIDALQGKELEPVRHQLDTAEYTLWRADALAALGESRQAADDYATYAWFRLDKPEIARPALDKALALDKDNPRARQYLQQLGK